jgi:hypothetical protein
VSADLAALDRGLIDAGVTAAEAVARVEALERQVEHLTARVAAIFDVMRETTLAAGLPSEEFREAARATADRGMSTRQRAGQLGLSVLRQELDAVTARLDAQDQAWSAWRAASGRQPPLPPRPVRHLSVVKPP